MEERDQILIERYLAGELTDAELSQFEQRKKDDPLFMEEVRHYEMAKEAIRIDEDEEILKRFKNLDTTLDRKGDKGTSRPFLYFWVSLAAIIILGLIGWRLNWFGTNALDSLSKVTTDTTGIEQEQPDISDSSKAPVFKEQEENKIDPNRKTEEEKPAMAGDAAKGKELFAEYFEPYKDDMMDPATRGESDPTPFTNFRQAYWDGRYKDVPGLFQKISPSQQKNDNYRFQLANALLHIGQTDSAIGIFKIIIKNKKSLYLTESYFDLGMAYLKKGDLENAKKNLEMYIKTEKALRKVEGEKVLEELNKKY